MRARSASEETMLDQTMPGGPVLSRGAKAWGALCARPRSASEETMP